MKRINKHSKSVVLNEQKYHQIKWENKTIQSNTKCICVVNTFYYLQLYKPKPQKNENCEWEGEEWTWTYKETVRFNAMTKTTIIKNYLKAMQRLLNTKLVTQLNIH